MDFRTVLEFDLDAVGNLQTGGLTEVLDAVDEFASDTLFYQFIGQFDIQCDSKDTIVGYEPARHVFRQNFHILGHYRVVESRKSKVESTFCFHLCNLVLGHRVDGSCQGFHVRTYFLTEHFEIRLDLLDKTNL